MTEKIVEQNKSLQAELEKKKQECKELVKQYNRLCKYQLEKKSGIEQEQANLIDEIIRYKQALDEIEEFVTPVEYPEVGRRISFGSVCHTQILDIINKAKEVRNGDYSHK